MKRANTLSTKSKEQWIYFAMLLPGVIFTFLFNTSTWPGIFAAFQDFKLVKGWFGSKWVGLENFEIFFEQPDSWKIIRNTLAIAVGKIVVGQVSAITFALLLNELVFQRLKKVIQTIVYFPHFISWVVFATVLKSIIGSDGMINQILAANGQETVLFLGMPQIFRQLMIGTDTLKEFGYSSIIYLAAITNIDPGLYEAAQIDGASRLQQTFHVTIPGISTIIVLNAVLALGSILSAGFDQIYNMYNTLVMSTGDVIDTWVYRMGMLNMNYGIGTAVGLLRSVIAMILTIFSYWAADKYADYKIF